MPADAIVVGGGPAGAATALILARAGVDVTIVERAKFPRRKVCGEYLNAGALAELDELGIGESVRAEGAHLSGVRLFASGVAPVELLFRRPAVALARERLDSLLLDAACAAGATLVAGRAEGLRIDAGRVAGVVVRDESGERRALAARIVVGADGIGSVVARKLGLLRLSSSRARYAIGGHYHGFASFGGFVEMYAGDGAYFALNPLSDERTNVMVVVRKAALASWSGAVDEGMSGRAAELARGYRSLADARRIGERVSIGPLEHRVRRRTAAGAVLVGDAAGSLNPFTGQGVHIALASAREAARAIRSSLEEPGSEESAFKDYERTRSADLVARARLSALIHLLVDFPFLARRAAARLNRVPALSTAILDALGGAKPPQSALRPAIIGRLFV